MLLSLKGIKDMRAKKNGLDSELEKIAKAHLFIDTLKAQNSDRLDFHEVSVWGIAEALESAYLLGLRHGKEKTR